MDRRNGDYRLIVGFVGLILFVIRELKAEVPMLDFRVFKDGIFFH